MSPRDALRAVAGYVRANPGSLVKAATDARHLRFGIPIRALRWVVSQANKDSPEGGGKAARKSAPKDIELVPSPPALKFAASVDAMGTPVRVTASIRIEDIYIAPDTIRVAIRVQGVALALLAESDAPIAILIKSGLLDLSKVVNVLKVLSKRPPVIVDAEGDRVVLDLLKIPALAKNERLRRALSVLSPVVGVRAIETDGEHLYIALRATPRGLREAVHAARYG